MADEPDLALTFNVYLSDPSPDWDKAWELTDALIRRLDEEAKTQGAQLVVVTVSAPEQVYPDLWATTFETESETPETHWDPEAPNRQLSAILDKADIPYLDLMPIFQDAAARPEMPHLYFRHDFHWSAAGHALAAQAAESFLRERGLRIGDLE